MPTTHKVQAGETISGIAYKYGFGTWQTIYDHESNAALKARKPDPKDLAPPDELVIPDKRSKTVECETGKEHVFTLKTLGVLVQFVLTDDDGLPNPGIRYELIAAGETFQGVTGDDGLVRQRVSPDAQSAEMTIWLSDDETDHWIIDLQH